MAYSSEENRYRLLLDKLAEGLTHGDVDNLVFLLRFLIEEKRNRISIHGDPRKLLTKLLKQNYIGVHSLALLLEVFDLIGRYDLIKEIERHGYYTSENCQISPFIRDLWNFGQKLVPKDLEKSAFLLGWDKEKEEIQKPWQLFEKAFERGNLEKDEYNKLKEFANTIGQTKTLESVMEDRAKKSIQGHQNIHDSHKEDHTQSQLQLISDPSPDDLSISQSRALPDPDIHTAKLVVPTKIPENHTQPNINTSLIKASEDFTREGERSDSQIHVAPNSKTFQNVAENTGQRSNTNQSSSEALSTLDQPDQNDIGEFRRSSKMVESAHPIDSAWNSDKSSYDGDKRDGQDADVTGTNAQQRTQDLSAVKNDTRKKGRAHCLEKKKEQTVSFLNNPRCGQIIELDISEMKEFCCWNDIIGAGAYGTVYKAKIDTKDDIGKYVIKKIEVAGFDDIRMKSYEREILHGRILHPHIIPIIAWAEDIFENKGAVYLMYPCMENGSVRKKIEDENNGELFCKDDETNSKIWLRCFYQVSQALDYLHKPGKNNSRLPVFHRDLTSSNILFDEDYNVKICDFGIAVEAKHHTSNVTATLLQGSKGYHPQSMNHQQYRAYDDVYSFCVLVLEILTGKVVEKEELYQKYKFEAVLIQAINTRADKNKVAQWSDDSLRDRLAKQAWGIIESDAKGGKAEVTAGDFFKDVRLETWRHYQQPKNPNRCVLCYVNPPAKNLSLMGEKCKDHSPPCAMYCIYCLSDHHNQLVCPLHGPSRPPFGDHVFGVFVAGNHVKHFQDKKKMTGKKQMSLTEIADIFTSDANKVASILKFPLVLGIRNEHLEVVTPKEPGREGEMIDSIQEAFEKINFSIRNVLTENEKNQDQDRLKNSLFIFYFTGHGSKEDGLYLGSERETINDSTEWLKKMLYETLRVDQVLVILDCCHAAKQNFARMKEESKIGILQLSSCDKDEKSICMEEDIKGSLFTHFLVQALQGDNVVKTGVYFRKLCKYCAKENEKNPHKRSHCEEFHISCSDRQSVTLNSVMDYIRGHYKLLGEELKATEHCADADEIHLGYYKPEMSRISICLEGAQNGDIYPMVSHPESIKRLKLCIVRYIEEKKIQCKIQDILEFYRKLHVSQTSAVEKTSSLISIQPVAGREAKELRRLEDLYKIIPCGRAVEAKIRDNLKELKRESNVMLYSLKRAMTRSFVQDYEADGLKISREYIHVQVNLIENVIERIIELQTSKSDDRFSQEFIKNLQDILLVVDENKNGTVLKFQLYDEFSIVEITQK